MDFQEYTFLAELIQVVQVIYFSVIRTATIQDLTVLTKNYLRKLKELFPTKI